MKSDALKWLFATAVVLLLAGGWSASALADESDPWRTQAPNLVLATVLLRETDTNAAVFVAIDTDQTAFISLAEFAQAAQLSLHVVDGQWQLETPLGRATFESNDIRYIDTDAYVAVPLLARKLASDVEFDASQFSLNVNPAWPPSAVPSDVEIAQPSGSQQTFLDAQAPNLSLSEVRSELLYRNFGESESLPPALPT